jgi:hypothetical protein
MSTEAPPPNAAATTSSGQLRTADPADVMQALAFALRYQGRRRVDTAGEAMARITAERLVEHLRAGRFVVMRKPTKPAGPDMHYGPAVPGRGDD